MPGRTMEHHPQQQWAQEGCQAKLARGKAATGHEEKQVDDRLQRLWLAKIAHPVQLLQARHEEPQPVSASRYQFGQQSAGGEPEG